MHYGCGISPRGMQSSAASSINILMQRPVVPILLQHSTAHLPDQGENCLCASWTQANVSLPSVGAMCGTSKHGRPLWVFTHGHRGVSGMAVERPSGKGRASTARVFYADLLPSSTLTVLSFTTVQGSTCVDGSRKFSRVNSLRVFCSHVVAVISAGLFSAVVKRF